MQLSSEETVWNQKLLLQDMDTENMLIDDGLATVWLEDAFSMGNCNQTDSLQKVDSPPNLVLFQSNAGDLFYIPPIQDLNESDETLDNVININQLLADDNQSVTDNQLGFGGQSEIRGRNTKTGQVFTLSSFKSQQRSKLRKLINKKFTLRHMEGGKKLVGLVLSVIPSEQSNNNVQCMKRLKPSSNESYQGKQVESTNQQQSNNKKLLKCHVCTKQFSKFTNLHRHLAIHKEEGAMYRCDICNCPYHYISSLTRHTVASHLVKSTNSSG